MQTTARGVLDLKTGKLVLDVYLKICFFNFIFIILLAFSGNNNKTVLIKRFPLKSLSTIKTKTMTNN